MEMDNGADEQTATQHTQGAAQQDALAAAPAAAPASAGAGTGGTDELTFDRDAVQSSTPGLLFRVGDIIDVQDTANSWSGTTPATCNIRAHSFFSPQVQCSWL